MTFKEHLVTLLWWIPVVIIMGAFGDFFGLEFMFGGFAAILCTTADDVYKDYVAEGRKG